MLKELWKFITNLGISKQMLPFDEKAMKLLNQVSFVMMLWFGVMTLMALIFTNSFEILLSFSNVVLFGGVLLINSFNKTTLSKHYFMIFGLAMVTFVNLAYPTGTFPIIQFIATAIFPVLIFRKRRTALIYVAINILLLIVVLNFHQHNPPLIISNENIAVPNPSIGVTIIMMIVFLVALFFRNVGEELERKLVQKNRYLNELIEKTQSMQEQLVSSEKMASLGQLTAGIAHEINNPINFVSSNISPVKTDLNELKDLCIRYKALHDSKDLKTDLQKIEEFTKEIDPEFLYDEIETLIKGIEEGAERTKQIVLGLRTFSRMDEDEFKETDIHAGLESTLMLLRNKIKNRIEVVKLYGDIPPVMCIPGKINQVLMNILNNAAEAIPEDGKIIVTTGKVDKSNKIFISIKDNGIGMSIAVRKRIFEPFYTTKSIGKGTGLGLSITYGIIEDHSGSIEVKSELNKGSEFIITLPVKQPEKKL